MKANDLRIGNYIHGKNEDEVIEVCRVVGYDPFESRIWVESEKSQREYWDEFEPIPLTEEWLVRFGFEKGVDFWNKGYFILHACLDGFEFRFQPFILIPSVHQLQNLYFALTGEELQL